MGQSAADSLSIVTQLGDGRAPIELVWRGKSRDRQPSRIVRPVVGDALARAAERGVALELRFDELEYFNSATVMAIIQVIHDARSRGVRLRLSYDDRLEWQRMSFEPMRVFATDDLLEIRSTASSPAAGSES
jgi:hypothetical protein